MEDLLNGSVFRSFNIFNFSFEILRRFGHYKIINFLLTLNQIDWTFNQLFKNLNQND